MGIGKKIETSNGATVSAPESSATTSTTVHDKFELHVPRYRLTDLVLSSITLQEIQRVIAARRHHDLVFNQWGLQKTHKQSNKLVVNLYGPPGTGKTMAAHAIAAEFGKKLILVNYADIESKYVGETPKNICAAFEYAKNEGAILFFDEADAILSRRVTNMSNSTDTSVNQTRSVLLNLLNEYNDIVIFATNFVSNYDPAFMRRILSHIKFFLPELNDRKRLFETYTPDELPNAFDFDYLAKISDGMSGSEVSTAVLASAFAAAQDGGGLVRNTHIEESISSILRSKQDNEGRVNMKERIVSEEYVIKALGKN
jgi:ATP-dependent 26S proteasome regulatory subunit